MALPAWLILSLAAAAFVGPLAATGELGVWVFDGPVSHLDWDEAMRADGEPAASYDAGADLDDPRDGAIAMWGIPIASAIIVGVWARSMSGMRQGE